jgi:hypothetical protein
MSQPAGAHHGTAYRVLLGSGCAAILAAAPVACGARSELRRGQGGSGESTGGHATATTGTGAATGTAASGGGGGAMGGAGGSGGTGGAAPDPTIVSACVIATSCGFVESYPGFGASGCIDGFARLGWDDTTPPQLPDPALADLVLTCAVASDCAAFRACFGGDWVGLGRCREGGWCSGATMMLWDAPGPSFDCSVIGAVCQDLWSGAIRACCNAEPCMQPSALACAGTTVSYCGGWGEHVSFDCGQSDRVCGSDPWGLCQGTGPACDEATVTTCSGSIATYCSDGKLATIDCATVPLRSGCAAGASAYDPPCRPAGSECDPIYDLDRCDGDDLVVCVDGHETSVSCPALGFSGCAEPDGSGNARCFE